MIFNVFVCFVVEDFMYRLFRTGASSQIQKKDFNNDVIFLFVQVLLKTFRIQLKLIFTTDGHDNVISVQPLFFFYCWNNTIKFHSQKELVQIEMIAKTNSYGWSIFHLFQVIIYTFERNVEFLIRRHHYQWGFSIL